VIGQDLADQTAEVLRTLTPREEEVIRMRFGLGHDTDRALEEIGRSFG
tara:strand:+ start:292 stop:435 length:144 start_codon:yes stop_codon:yes gene_type:complete